jgi:hypothetical protein
MQQPDVKPFDHPAAWQSTDFASKDDLAIDLEARHVEALLDEVERVKSVIAADEQVTPGSFRLTAIQDDVARWRQIIHEGRGILLLRGFPVDRVDFDDLRLMYLGLGVHFGRPVSQSPLGELIGDVVNIGDDDLRERAYRTRRALRLHTDRCDHIGMLCIRPAAHGGISGYASALTIHNVMHRERPDLLEPLYRGYFHHRFGQQPPGEPLVTTERIPIFSVTKGVPSVIFIQGYIDLAEEEGHISLTEHEREALDVMEEVANRPDIRLDFALDAGEASFTNNCLLLHTRTAFTDADDPAKRRHLLRLWLREDRRPMAPGVLLHKGPAGIEKQAGGGTYYTPPGTAST